jgi:hypothetical protein
MAKRRIQFLFFASLILLGVALWKKDELPQFPQLQQQLMKEPQQVPVRRAAFETTVNGVTYRIQPLYSYDLYGLVVSMHDARTWWDSIHQEWNDHLNVMDLCVVWGNNLRRGVYKEADYSSTEFECYVKINSSEVVRAFDQTALSNNHLLTDKPDVARAIRKVRLGDQIHFRGYLAEYSHNHNGRPFHRGTSIVRDDTGNRACETVFVEDFQVLRPGGSLWRIVIWFALLLLATSVIAWFRLPLSSNA